MIATLLPQIKDRTVDVENGELSGITLKNEIKRLGVFVDGLKERVDKLPKDETRTNYLKTVQEAFEKLKAAKAPKEEVQEEKISVPKKEEPKLPEFNSPTPAVPPAY